MLMDMIKKPKTIDDVFEKLGELATRAEVDAKIDKLATHMNAKIDASVGGLAIMVEKGFAETAQDLSALTERVKTIEIVVKGHDKELTNIHGDFNAVSHELKSIREHLGHIEKNDLQPDVIALDLRVRKLEKKAGLQ